MSHLALQFLDPLLPQINLTRQLADDFDHRHRGFLSIDIKNGCVVPSCHKPVDVLRQANGWKFDGCIILNIGAVGTETGLNRDVLEMMRAAYHRKIFWGGGIASSADLHMLQDAGFDGAIIATALHHGKIPMDWIRKGRVC